MIEVIDQAVSCNGDKHVWIWAGDIKYMPVGYLCTCGKCKWGKEEIEIPDERLKILYD